MLPDSFDQLTNLQKLNLSCGKESEKMSTESFEESHVFSFVNVNHGLHRDEVLPENFGQPINLYRNSKLKPINLSRNSKLKNLPESSGDLQQLQNLDLSYCASLETLPDSFCQLTNLEELHLRGMNLKTLPDSFGQLTNLQRLDLDGNRELKRLPESFGKLFGLEVLNMEGCRKLEMLPDIFGQLTNLRFLKINNCSIVNIVRGGPLQRFHKLRITEAWPITKLVLMEDNPESWPMLSRILNNHLLLNNHLPSNSYRWLEELPLYPITVMDAYMSGLLPYSKVRDELTRESGAIHKCLFRRLQRSPSSSTTWVAEGKHCKLKCIGAAICFDLFSDAYFWRGLSVVNRFSFGCTKWDPISYTTGGGTSVFCMAVYDPPEEVSLDKMSVHFPFYSPQGSAGWVCYFLERDEDLLRHARNSFAMACRPSIRAATGV